MGENENYSNSQKINPTLRRESHDDIDEVFKIFSGATADQPSRQKNPEYDDIDQVLKVFSEPATSPTRQANKATSEVASKPKSASTYNLEEMRKKSTSGKYNSNQRHKTTTTKKWQRTAIGIALAASMFAGGYLARPLEEVVDYITNWSKLKEMTSSFEENVIEKSKSKTYTNDVSLDYQRIANAIEADGLFTNQELLMAVDTIGEVQTNNVLSVAANPPAESVEAYMRNNNISDMKDWKAKTIKAMSATDNLAEAQAELDSIFRDEKSTTQSTQDYYTDSTTYGGK